MLKIEIEFKKSCPTNKIKNVQTFLKTIKFNVTNKIRQILMIEI